MTLAKQRALKGSTTRRAKGRIRVKKGKSKKKEETKSRLISKERKKSSSRRIQ